MLLCCMHSSAVLAGIVEVVVGIAVVGMAVPDKVEVDSMTLKYYC